MAVIMRDDVAHTAHLAERKRGQQGAGCIRYMCGGFTDDFDTADHSILLFRIRVKLLGINAADITLNQEAGLPDIPQPA